MPIIRDTQAPNKLYPGVLIRRFLANSEVYEHVIFPDEDDRVECRNIDQDVILTYTAHCDVLDKHKRHIGRFKMSGNEWCFVPTSGSPKVFGPDLLAAEIGVSEMYLRGEL